MHAVIETGGKQYRVAVGDKLKVEKIPAAEGDTVSLDRVLMILDEDRVTVGTPLVDSQVNATVLSHGRADKIKVFKMKRRKNYRRTQGPPPVLYGTGNHRDWEWRRKRNRLINQHIHL